MKFIRLVAKRLWLRLGGSLTEYCKDCGRRQPIVWTAPDALWARVSGRSDGSGVLCPECFDIRATRLGLLLRWRPEVEE